MTSPKAHFNASDIEQAREVRRRAWNRHKERLYNSPAYMLADIVEEELAAALAAARQEERERCAKIALNRLASVNGADAVEIAAAIREVK